jgi:hypothetical protein
MRFLALCSKEWRESYPFVLAAMLAVAVLGYGIIRTVTPWLADGLYADVHQRGRDIDTFYRYPYGGIGGVLWLAGLGLGLCLGVRHFWVPSLAKTWAFQIHRSVGRSQILAAKMLVALLGIEAGLGLVWAGVYAYSHMLQQELIRPPYARVFLDGFIYLSFGSVVYLATALAGLMSTRWYTTRFFSFAWAFLLFICVVQAQLTTALICLTMGLLVMSALLWDQFDRQEFE